MYDYQQEMNRIPFEIQQLLPSPRWLDQIVDPTCPFRIIRIRHTYEFQTVESFFQKEESYRNQVQNLEIFGGGDSKNCLAALLKLLALSLFTNLRDVHWYDDPSTTRVYDINEENAKSWNSITSFRETGGHSLSAEILKHGGFRNLTELEVRPEVQDKCTFLIQQLSNAPQLKILKLTNYYISIVDIKDLHCNAKKLKTLHLKDIILWKSEGVPVVADPSTSLELTELVFSNVFYPEVGGLLMEYMGGQYENLEQLTMENLDLSDQAGLNSMIARFSHLKSYSVSCPITASTLDAMNKSKAQLKEINLEGDVDKQIELLQVSNQRHSLETIKNMESTFAQNLGKFSKLKHLVNLLPNDLKHLETLKLNWNSEACTSALPDAYPLLSKLSIDFPLTNQLLKFPSHRFSSIKLKLPHDHNNRPRIWIKVVNTTKNRTIWHEYDAYNATLRKSHDSPTFNPDDLGYTISVEYAHCDNLIFGNICVPSKYL